MSKAERQKNSKKNMKIDYKSKPWVLLDYLLVFVHIIVPLLTFYTVLHVSTLFIALLVKRINWNFCLCFGACAAVRYFPVLFSFLNAQWSLQAPNRPNISRTIRTSLSLERLDRHFQKCLCCSWSLLSLKG